eukprot:314529-Prorocentrum_minimum.AAC.2
MQPLQVGPAAQHMSHPAPLSSMGVNARGEHTRLLIYLIYLIDLPGAATVQRSTVRSSVECTAVYSMYSSVKQCRAVSSSVEQCRAVYNSVQQCTTVYNSVEQCSVEQCSVEQCSVEQCRAVQCRAVQSSAQCSVEQCSVQQCTTVYNSVQQCTTVYSSVQQCTAVYSSAEQCSVQQCSAPATHRLVYMGPDSCSSFFSSSSFLRASAAAASAPSVSSATFLRMTNKTNKANQIKHVLQRFVFFGVASAATGAVPQQARARKLRERRAWSKVDPAVDNSLWRIYPPEAANPPSEAENPQRRCPFALFIHSFSCLRGPPAVWGVWGLAAAGLVVAADARPAGGGVPNAGGGVAAPAEWESGSPSWCRAAGLAAELAPPTAAAAADAGDEGEGEDASAPAAAAAPLNRHSGWLFLPHLRHRSRRQPEVVSLLRSACYACRVPSGFIGAGCGRGFRTTTLQP